MKAMLMSEENAEENSTGGLEGPCSEIGTVDSIGTADLPANLLKFENFRTVSGKVIYRRPLRFGWFLSETDTKDILEFSTTDSDLEDDLGWILNRFLDHYKIEIVKLENSHFLGDKETVCTKFCDQFLGLTTLSSVSLDRTDLHGCDLATLFRMKVAQLSLRFCHIEDKEVETFWEPLSVSESIRTLNLNFNRIGRLGCNYLARSLRLNRALNCLSLMHNAIDNEGCLNIVAILQAFHLEKNEVLFLRKLKLDKYRSTLDENGKPTQVTNLPH
ncbi:hypothetical protein WDU94_014266 [Cyamophila willieti]